MYSSSVVHDTIVFVVPTRLWYTGFFFGVSHSALLQQIKHHSTTERLSFELGELSKSKRELLEVVDHKNTELDEKNASIKSYLTKVVGVFASLLSYTSLPVRFNPQTPVAVAVLSYVQQQHMKTL